MKIPFCTGLSNVSKRLGALKVVVEVANFEPITNHGFETNLQDVFAAPDEEGRPAWKRWQSEPPTDDEADLARVAREYAQLAKALGLIDSGNSIRETAMPLRSFCRSRDEQILAAWKAGVPNPLEIDAAGGVSEKALLWHVLVSGDIPVCAFAQVLGKRPDKFYNPNDEFKAADEPTSGDEPHHTPVGLRKKLAEVERNLMTDSFALVRLAFNESLWSEVENLDELRGYCERMKRWSSFRHHVPPRIDWLVDLGLLKPSTATLAEDERTGTKLYAVLDSCRRAGTYLDKHLLHDFDSAKFLQHRLFSFLGTVYDLTTRPAKTDEEAFEFLARGYHAVVRDIGDTPIKSAAMMGCILALQKGVLINLQQMYAVGAKPPSKYASAVEYSGGSRLDEEFLFSIRTKFLSKIMETQPPDL